jgi:hypothetical protein
LSYLTNYKIDLWIVGSEPGVRAKKPEAEKKEESFLD